MALQILRFFKERPEILINGLTDRKIFIRIIKHGYRKILSVLLPTIKFSRKHSTAGVLADINILKTPHL